MPRHMNRRHAGDIVDLALAACVLYLVVWLYEAANYLVLSLSGGHATLVVKGILPAGTVAVGVGAYPEAAKLLQVAIAMGVLVPAYAVLRGRFYLAQIALLTVMASVLASFYWEYVALLAPIPLAANEAFSTVITAGVLVLLARADSNLRGLIW